MTRPALREPVVDAGALWGCAGCRWARRGVGVSRWPPAEPRAVELIEWRERPRWPHRTLVLPGCAHLLALRDVLDLRVVVLHGAGCCRCWRWSAVCVHLC